MEDEEVERRLLAVYMTVLAEMGNQELATFNLVSNMWKMPVAPNHICWAKARELDLIDERGIYRPEVAEAVMRECERRIAEDRFEAPRGAPG